MEKDGTLKILNYYLEYEIYNLANSTQIKTDMNNCYIIKEKIDAGKVLKELNRLKQNKIRSVTEKFVGKKVQNKETLINDIIKNFFFILIPPVSDCLVKLPYFIICIIHFCIYKRIIRKDSLIIKQPCCSCNYTCQMITVMRC